MQIKFIPNMYKYSHAQQSVSWNYLLIPKLQQLPHESLDK